MAMKEWLELLRHLGDAVLDLIAAEATALTGDLRRGGRQALGALLFAAVAGVLGVLAWCLLTLALVWGLATVVDPWLAALLVGAVYVVGAIACAAAARRRFRKIEPPVDVVRRRWEEQSTWFRNRILALPPEQGSRDDG
jgi:membrane protein